MAISDPNNPWRPWDHPEEVALRQAIKQERRLLYVTMLLTGLRRMFMFVVVVGGFWFLVSLVF